MMTFFNLYLACMHTLIEAWDKSYLYDHKVYSLLKKGYGPKLEGFRNAVFHAEPWDDIRVVRVYDKHRDVRAWADQLIDAIGHFFRRELRRTP